MQHPKENSGISNDIKENIEKGNELSITEKIKILRNHKGVSQQAISDYVLMDQKKISRIENGKDEYDDIELKAVKEYFDIVGMPLTEDECSEFRSRLYYWRDLIRDRRIDEAVALQDELKNIVNLDVLYFDLPVLYRFFEILLLIAKNGDDDLDVAKEKLLSLENRFDNMTEEHRYYYDFYMGLLHTAQNDFEIALQFYKKALERKKSYNGNLLDTEEKIHYNMALCYTDLEFPSRALMFLNKIPKRNPSEAPTKRSLGIDIMFAINHYKIGLYDEAENILTVCLRQAKDMNDKLYIGLTLHHLGIAHRYSKNWGMAIEYFDQALNFFDEDTRYHAWALYYKIRCMVGLRDFNGAERALKQMPSLLKKNDKYIILFETLKHIAYLSRNVSRYDKTSVEYLEKVSIPLFIKRNSMLEALDCYKILERHFIGTSKQKKSLETNRAMLEIYERMV